MKIGRKQIVGNIHFVVESNFRKGEAKSAKERLSEIIVRKASEALRCLNQAKVEAQNEPHILQNNVSQYNRVDSV